jgi:hypothetical protein
MSITKHVVRLTKYADFYQPANTETSFFITYVNSESAQEANFDRHLNLRVICLYSFCIRIEQAMSKAIRETLIDVT